ncbi:GCN5 family acetyltransferase [Paenibacillus glacialis]|uniref:GCN5 family acetyltransferase n=1 Tax=Paenibacillus glacialis TaxID=494026 RepID=A0A168HN87_9BACL|nr:GCN5 family acetyltransferase [Paenibacillus glacialis]
MIIRPFESDDLRKCTTLFVNVFNREPWNDNWSIEAAKQYLVDYIQTPGFRGFIAEDGSEIRGFIFGFRKRWWEGDEFFVNEMCVQVDEQRSGIGTKLINYIEGDLIHAGIENITLLTNREIPAEEFYKKNGFNEIERLIFLHKRIK